MKVKSSYKYLYYTSKQEDIDESPFNIGDVVINSENEIGVILAIYDRGEVRTDMFGVVSENEIRLAIIQEIIAYRVDLLPELYREEV
jgi:hypothetical protein